MLLFILIVLLWYSSFWRWFIVCCYLVTLLVLFVVVFDLCLFLVYVGVCMMFAATYVLLWDYLVGGCLCCLCSLVLLLRCRLTVVLTLVSVCCFDLFGIRLCVYVCGCVLLWLFKIGWLFTVVMLVGSMFGLLGCWLCVLYLCYSVCCLVYIVVCCDCSCGSWY